MIEGKKPKIMPIEDQLKESIASLCSVDKSKIGITATSGEGLTIWGRGLGIQCFSVITITKK